MLFSLGFSEIPMDAVDDSEIEAHDSNTDVIVSNTPSSRADHSVNLNVSNRMWKVTMNLAPQDIWIEIRINVDVQRYFVELKKGSEISRFA